jgi:hypothetical protein
MILFLALMYGVHNSIKDGLGENGILYWGAFHGWNEVNSYLFENDVLLKMKISQKKFGLKFNNEIKLIINPKEKDDIVRFLEEKIIL